MCAALDACLRLKWYPAQGNWTAAEWNQVIFSDESKFYLSSDENRVRVWRPLGERLNPAFALQLCTAPTAVVMVWGASDYNTQSPLVLIHGTMTVQRKRMEDSEHWRAVGRIEAGQSIKDAALFFGIHHYVISGLWKQFQTTQTVVRRPVGGPPRVTTPTEDRYIAIVAKRNRKVTSTV
ncbi:transposable element Tcb1 transposase [Trichonephila clavipes]|nr:transposable element Tcb1 transposase [Trichonephila clavipes]